MSPVKKNSPGTRARRSAAGARRRQAGAPDAASLRRGRVLVVGDVMLDRYLFGEVSRISPEAPVPVVHVTREEERPGGAANVARNAAALGARVTLLSVIGADEYGARLRALVRSEGIRASLRRDKTVETIRKVRVVGRQQQLLRIDFERTPSREILRQKLADYRKLIKRGCDVVVLSDYGKGGLTHIVEMIELAHRHGRRILVDPKGDDYARYRGADVLTPNRSELRAVVGQWSSESDLRRRAQALRLDLRVQALLVTRSEEGMTLFDADGVHHEPARAREVYDVSGAGDTVIATLAVMIAAGAGLRDAMRIANHAASIVVGKLGTAVAGPDELFGGPRVEQ